MSEIGQGKPGRFVPNVAHLRKLLAEATPTPWEVDPTEAEVAIVSFAKHPTMVATCEFGAREANAALIVAAVNTLGMCLDEIDLLEREVAEERGKRLIAMTLAEEATRTGEKWRLAAEELMSVAKQAVERAERAAK